MTFHPKFPFGKGMWIWNLSQCEGGDISKIIDKCKKYGVNYLIIKSYDGENAFPNNANWQLTRQVTDQFHANGISIYSWSFNYGYNPEREAALALWSLEQLGVDGHVFNAESEWRDLSDPAGAAHRMLKIVRDKHPEAFLAHAPFPYIKYHTKFPYKEFGYYCDAVMPQVYHGTIGITVEQMIADMYEQWTNWERQWIASGHGQSVKPIIPLGQVYDNPITNFVLTPPQLKEFMTRTAGYRSVNFWSWQHMLRPDLWEAFRDTPIKGKPETETPPNNSQNSNTTVPVTTTPEVPVIPTVPSTPTSPILPPVGVGSPATDGVSQIPPVLPVPVVPIVPSTTEIPISETGKTTVTVVKDSTHPTGLKVEISLHKPHIEYVIDFFTYIFSLFSRKGGDNK